jgi:hypothetical protein
MHAVVPAIPTVLPRQSDRAGTSRRRAWTAVSRAPMHAGIIVNALERKIRRHLQRVDKKIPKLDDIAVPTEPDVPIHA